MFICWCLVHFISFDCRCVAQTDGQTEGWMDRWMDDWMDGWMEVVST